MTVPAGAIVMDVPAVCPDRLPARHQSGDIVCAWCGRKIGHDKRLGGVSHGMCTACREVFMATPA